MDIVKDIGSFTSVIKNTSENYLTCTDRWKTENTLEKPRRQFHLDAK